MGRAPCCDKANVKRGPWSPEEDSKLKDYIEKYGTGGNWIALPQKAGLKRCGKSCRLRWLNYLRPNIKHGEFSDEEDRIICALYATIGSRWSIIAAQLPGRTDNDIKNYWNTKLKKKLMGLLPALSHQRKHSAFQSSNHQIQNPPPSPSPSSQSMYRDHCGYYYTPPNVPFTATSTLEPFSLITSSATTTSMSLPLLYQNQESSMPMQYYPMNMMRESLVMFGSEASCSCSSSDGSCSRGQGREKIIKQEDQMGGSYDQINHNNYMFDEFRNNKFMLSYGGNGGDQNSHSQQWAEKSSGSLGQNHLLDFDLEDIKQLISGGSSSCFNNINIDENKTEEKGTYYY